MKYFLPVGAKPPKTKQRKNNFRSLLATNYIFHINLAVMECCVKCPHPKHDCTDDTPACSPQASLPPDQASVC